MKAFCFAKDKLIEMLEPNAKVNRNDCDSIADEDNEDDDDDTTTGGGTRAYNRAKRQGLSRQKLNIANKRSLAICQS